MSNDPLVVDRLWIPRGAKIEFSRDFFDAEVIAASVTPQTYVTSLNPDISCVVLLGPPGIGKSTEFDLAVQMAASNGYLTVQTPLRGISTSEELRTIVQSRLETEKGRTLWFLDGLDESPVSTPVAQQWLLRAFAWAQERSPGTLLPRISVRTADWSSEFEDQLRELWGNNGVEVFELAPLTEPQALAYVSSKNTGSSDAFWSAIRDSGATPFASRPITLRMLLAGFLQQGSLAIDKTSLFRRGILALLEESNRARRALGIQGELDADKRFALSCRIAAASVFSTKALIWDGLYSDPIPPNVVTVSELSGGIEQALGEEVTASPKHIRETLKTALFRPIAQDTFDWSHKTFAEFLAAQYVRAGELTTAEQLALVRSGLPGNDRIVPQLREVAAWLCTFNRDLFRILVESEPETLLSSDVALEADIDRHDLVAHLIGRLDSGEAYDKIEWRSNYSRLNYPGLAEQIGPVITAHSDNIVLRRTAIDIAEACLRRDLLPQLRQVALDASDNAHIRSQAVHALMKILRDQEQHELVPIAINPKNDPDDEIKGWALQSTWPKHLTAPELFEALTKPKNESLIGSYSMFLYRLDFGRLNPTGALAALQWIEGLDLEKDVYRSFEKLVPKALGEVWRNIDDDRVLAQLAKFVLRDAKTQSLLRHQTELKTFQDEYLEAEPTRRQKLINMVLAHAPKDWNGAQRLTFLPWQMVARPDLRWLVDDLLQTTDEAKQKNIIELIIRLIDWENFKEIEFVWDVSDKHQALKEALSAISVIPLDSDYVKWKREDKKLSQERTKAKPEHDAKVVALELLERTEQDDLNAFWRLNAVLLEEENGQVEEYTGVVTSGIVWQALNSDERRRVVAAAVRYLNSYPLTQNYFAPQTLHRPAAAGYRAFRLLLSEDFDAYSAVAAETWAKWALPIISFSSNDSNSERKNQQRIAQDCNRQAPAALLSAFSTYLKVSNDFYQVANLIEDWPNTPILDVVWSALKEAKVDKNIYERVLSQLLPNCRPALELAKTSFESLFSPQRDSSEFAITAAAELFRTNPREHWDRLRELVSAQPDIARDLITSLGSGWRDRNSSEEARPTPMQNAEMYVWIERLFARPPEEKRAHSVTAVHEVFNFQGACLRTLTASGSNEAVKAITWITEQLPTVDWLKWSLEDAKENQRRLEWAPLAPKSILELIRHQTIESQPSSDKEKLLEEAEYVNTEGGASISEGVSSLPQTVPMPNIKSPVAPLTESPLNFLIVNDEWVSGHGGISTFNRHLCIALAKFGHRVVCFIPRAGDFEIDQARKYGVLIVRAMESPGLTDSDLLLAGPNENISPPPDVVIGHDQVSGREALVLAKRFGCPYLHFIHSSPEELEPMKLAVGDVNYLKGSMKAQLQNSISLESDVVLAVGPNLHRHMKTALIGGKEGATNVIEIIPGLNPELLNYHRPEDYEYELICLLSGRLDEVVIKGTELFVKIAGKFQTHPVIKGARFIMRGFRAETMNPTVANLQNQCGAKPFNMFPRIFTTEEETLENELKSATVFLMPSKFEGFGLTGLDAISAGVPLIASSASGLGQLLVRHSKDFSGDLRRIAGEAILDVEPDSDAVLSNWHDRLTTIFTDPKKALIEANDLRKALEPKVSWSLAAQTVTAAARKALNGK